VVLRDFAKKKNAESNVGGNERRAKLLHLKDNNLLIVFVEEVIYLKGTICNATKITPSEDFHPAIGLVIRMDIPISLSGNIE